MYQYEATIMQLIDEAVRSMKARPLVLGGVQGSGGGVGGPPGGFYGYLPQTRVAYDLSEAEDNAVAPSGSLLDNLNHIRYRIGVLESGGTAGGHTIEDEGVPLTQRTNLNFVGTVVTVTDDAVNDRTIVTISGGASTGGHTIQEEGTPLASRSNLNFIGNNITASDDSGNDTTKITLTDQPYVSSGIEPITPKVGDLWYDITDDSVPTYPISSGTSSIETTTDVDDPGSDLVVPTEKAVRTALNLFDGHKIYHRGSTADATDDEFDDDSINVAWTQVTPTGAVNWVEGNHVLSCLFSGQTANDACCILKEATLSDGTAFETCINPLLRYVGYDMVGLIVTDGTATSSKVFSAMCYVDGATSACRYIIEAWTGTITNVANKRTSIAAPFPYYTSPIKLQLFRTDATHFGLKISTVAGSQFSDFDSGTYDPGFTPTHAGLFVSTWGAASKAMASFEYFRRM